MSLEAQASERKNRLAALRNKRKPTSIDTDSEQSIKKPTPEKVVISRNYNPETQEPVQGFNNPPTILDENSETVEAVSQKIQDEILLKFEQRANLAFQKQGGSESVVRQKVATNDLLRDLQPKLDILKERTDEAINKIVKERIRKLREQATVQGENDKD